ncbi:hypothetical protein, partial [Roseibacillus persicicus]|uniref:hypothetical protein n=1 Tax=Roseibacillus persicicus TaxID=454148 RepID=UPI00280E5E06
RSPEIMTQLSWVKRHLKGNTEFDSETLDSEAIGKFIEALAKSKNSMTRTEFWKLYEELDPEEGDYSYDILGIRLEHSEAQLEVWDLEPSKPLSELKTVVSFRDTELPPDFLQLGGVANREGPPPICSECDADMVLLTQLSSVPWDLERKHEELGRFQFGDAGRVYLHFCPDCNTFDVDLFSH